MSSTSQRSDTSDWIDVQQEMTPKQNTSAGSGSSWANSSSSSSSSSSRPSFADILRAGSASKNESTSSSPFTSRLIAYAEPAPSSSNQQRPESPMEQFSSSPFDSFNSVVAPSPFELLSREDSDMIVWVPSPRRRNEEAAAAANEKNEEAEQQQQQEYEDDEGEEVEDEEEYNEQAAFDHARSFDNDAEYNTSYTSLGDFFVPPPKKTGVQFRILHSPQGENMSNKLFRPRHRELANFVVKEVQHPKRRNYGIEHDYSYYHTKESSERLQFQAQNEQRRLAAIAKLKPHAHHMYSNLREENQPTSSFASPVVASPYQTTLPKPKSTITTSSYEQTREESEPANEALRRALAQVEESLAITTPHLIATRPVMLNASASHQTLLADRYARQQAAKQAQSNHELQYARKESGSSARPKVEKPKPLPRPNYYSMSPITIGTPKPDERYSLLPSVGKGFEAFRAQFWKRYQGEITKPFECASTSWRVISFNVTSVRLCSAAKKVRDAFMSRLNADASEPLGDEDIRLCYFGDSSFEMQRLLSHGLTHPRIDGAHTQRPSNSHWGSMRWLRYSNRYQLISRGRGHLLGAETEKGNTIPWLTDCSTLFVCALDMRGIAAENRSSLGPQWDTYAPQTTEILFSASDRLVPLFFLDFEEVSQSNLTEKETPPPISPRTARILLDKWNVKARHSARGISKRQPQNGGDTSEEDGEE